MKRNFWITFLKVSSIVLFIQGTSFALDTSTHKAINLRIARSTAGFSLDQYLKNNLDFSQGIGETFDGKKVDVWLELGGLYEDIPPWSVPYLRSFNHYHNPLKDQGYYNGTWMSSTRWALLPSATQSPGGYYSWYDVRGYYLNALTATDPDTRNTDFALTFRGLGQLMHLVQDVSVPAHTRDDGHLFYNYETWVKKNANISGYTPFFFDGNLTTIAPLFDTNQYNGMNPGITLSSAIGLAEYTNANFASEETIFTENFAPTDRHYFPYPRRSSVEKYTEIVDSYTIWGPVYRTYFRKVRDGETVEHFATAGRLYKYLGDRPDIQRKFISLDDRCYRDYAEKLIPNAVGYSAGLLNYFFRGEIDMVKDPGDSSQYIIKNLSAENMSGTFSLCYDDANNNRTCFTSWGLNIANGQGASVTFTEPTAPEPKEKGKYILVFNGALGGEEGAVAGKVVTLCSQQTVTISGPDTAALGSCYTAEGGTPSYTYEMSCGSIGENGCVSDISNCGSVATITVTDSCENQATKEVAIHQLQIEGTDTPICRDFYTAVGGTPPYTWNISCGQIFGSLDVQKAYTCVLGCCGTGTITVTDANGKIGTKEVRMPEGEWVDSGQIMPTPCYNLDIYMGVCRWDGAGSYFCMGEGSTCGIAPSLEGCMSPFPDYPTYVEYTPYACDVFNPAQKIYLHNVVEYIWLYVWSCP